MRNELERMRAREEQNAQRLYSQKTKDECQLIQLKSEDQMDKQAVHLRELRDRAQARQTVERNRIELELQERARDKKIQSSKDLDEQKSQIKARL